MLDEEKKRIEQEGSLATAGAQRYQLLKYGLQFPVQVKASFVIVLGCYVPFSMINPLLAFKNLMEHFEVDYSLLKFEHCCGGPLLHSVVQSEEVDEVEGLCYFAEKRLAHNVEQVLDLGGKYLVAFCPVCYVLFKKLIKDAKTPEIITYGELLNKYFSGGTYHGAVDYYEGCYRFHKKISPVSYPRGVYKKMLEQIEGLEVHALNNDICCVNKAERIVSSMSNHHLVNICTGCYFKTYAVSPRRVKFFTELIWEAVSKQN